MALTHLTTNTVRVLLGVSHSYTRTYEYIYEYTEACTVIQAPCRVSHVSGGVWFLATVCSHWQQVNAFIGIAMH